MRRSLSLVIVVLVVAWAVEAAGRGVLTCRDGALRCDADGIRNRECVLNVCEAGRCGCALVGCCIPEFCVGRAEPDVQVILRIPKGKRFVEETVEYGVGRWTLRCRRGRR